MGNAMIQPTMYFNLRYVPMFTGAYWITSVVHTISPQDFTTSFSGVRISKYAFPNFGNLTMSVNIDLLRGIKRKKKLFLYRLPPKHQQHRQSHSLVKQMVMCLKRL
jgi:hypothetical protein